MIRKPTPSTLVASLLRTVLLTPVLSLLISSGHSLATDTSPQAPLSQPAAATSPEADDAAAKAVASEIAQWEEKARQNDPEALNKLGMAYLDGRGVVQDDAKAAQYFRKSAELGSWKGQGNLGIMCIRGRGVAKDPAEGLKWMRQAADQGVPAAQLNLAAMLDRDPEVPNDLKEAVTWYEKAAAGGSALAAAELGRIYLSGEEGFPQDYVTAVKWFRQAADAGDPNAQNSLGVLLQYGRGVEKNIDEAAEWYERAANQGNARAQVNMGLLYIFDGGLYRDNIAAYKWLSLSAEQDWGIAKNILSQFKRGLTPDELAEAQNQIKLYKADRQKANLPVAASPQK